MRFQPRTQRIIMQTGDVPIVNDARPVGHDVRVADRHADRRMTELPRVRAQLGVPCAAPSPVVARLMTVWLPLVLKEVRAAAPPARDGRMAWKA